MVNLDAIVPVWIHILQIIHIFFSGCFEQNSVPDNFIVQQQQQIKIKHEQNSSIYIINLHLWDWMTSKRHIDL